MGRQAQIIPTFNSIVHQNDTSQLSHVGLVDLAKLTRDWKRRTLTTVTLRQHVSVSDMFQLMARVSVRKQGLKGRGQARTR